MEKINSGGLDNLIGRLVRYKDASNYWKLTEPMWVLGWYIDKCVTLVLVDVDNKTHEQDLSVCIFEAPLVTDKPSNNIVHHAGLNSLIGKRVSHTSPAGPTVISVVFDWYRDSNGEVRLILTDEHGFLKYNICVENSKVLDE
jgi:hypothetical protein